MNRAPILALLALAGLSPGMLVASQTAPRPVAAFLTAHLLLFAGVPAAVVVGTVGLVLWLRRFAVPDGLDKLTRSALRQPSRASTARPVLAARPRRAVGGTRQDRDGGAR